ncbi:MAG: NADH-quinone oxidoreductase subunit B family protein [Acidimicrobiales bacterium]
MSSKKRRPRSIVRSIFTTPATEAAPEAPPKASTATSVRLHGSLQLRHVDAGSCNGCELEISSAFAPTYDASRFGVRLVASPRHADGLLITGVVTRNMLGPLVRAMAATPQPNVIVACGDCAVNGGIFAGAYGVASPLEDLVEADVRIEGCPPHPDAIIRALRSITEL